ncbi:organic cation transporter protein [Plakobranchus ocellatus]|uniref:Organic cation transporter protein n=1 Tax=Plakobranchus ocellatus TaxID=259542 RepID=A0AAV4CX92_9GAST|nr:organic cation transporter protein [Plakobranchus ocellatus]
MKFDDILEQQVGEFGPYQKRIYVLVCLPAVAAAFLSLLPVFILTTPKHRCHIPGLDNDTYAIQSEYHLHLINISIPWEYDEHDRKWERSNCDLYTYGNDSKELEESPWMETDFNMVCDASIYKYHFKMITFFGSFCGAILTGFLSDLYGRKLIFLSSLLAAVVVTLIQLVSPFLWIFLGTRFLQGVCGAGVFSVSFVYVMEIVGPNYRMFAGIFIEIFWCFGLFLLVGTAYLIHYWKYLVATMSVPALFFFFYTWLIPESPRWLMSAGKYEHADKILQKIARSNKRQLPSKLLEMTSMDENSVEVKAESAKVWRILRHKVLFLRTLIIAFNRFVIDLGYYGISLNVDHLSGNLFINYTLSSAVETAGIVVVLLLISRLGRKPLYSGSMVIGALGFLLSTLPTFFGDDKDEEYSVGLVMVGKFGVSAAYAVIYVYCSEIFPTSVRSSAMALMFICGMIGAVVSPYVVEISESMSDPMRAAFPMLVFGSSSLAAALLSLLLPETKDKNMPDNIDDIANQAYETRI